MISSYPYEGKYMKLTEQQKEEVFEEIRNDYFFDFFKEVPHFHQIVESKLKNAINDFNMMEISEVNTKYLVEKYFEKSEFRTAEYDASANSLKFKSTEEFLARYEQHKEFQNFRVVDNVTKQELNYLFKFRNLMVVALMFIPSKLHKKFLMQICARLEGSNRGEYVCGGGSAPETLRRVKIYEIESHISKSDCGGTKRKKIPAKTPPVNMSSNRKKSNVSLKTTIAMTKNRVTEQVAVKLSMDKKKLKNQSGHRNKRRKCANYIIPQINDVITVYQPVSNYSSMQSMVNDGACQQNKPSQLTRFFSTLSEYWPNETADFNNDPTFNLEQIRAELNGPKMTKNMKSFHPEQHIMEREFSLDCSICTVDLDDALQDEAI
eukprot:gene9936-13366_t